MIERVSSSSDQLSGMLVVNSGHPSLERAMRCLVLDSSRGPGLKMANPPCPAATRWKIRCISGATKAYRCARVRAIRVRSRPGWRLEIGGSAFQNEGFLLGAYCWSQTHLFLHDPCLLLRCIGT